MARPPRRHSPALRRLRDQAGMTLLDLLVAAAIMALILTPVLYILTQGTRTEATASRQFTLQEKAHRVLGRIVDGQDAGTGLRQASEVVEAAADRLSYRLSSGKQVSYCADGHGNLFRYEDQDCPPVPGGDPILTDVVDFSAAGPGADDLVDLVLEVRRSGAGGGGGDPGVRLATRVRLRNR